MVGRPAITSAPSRAAEIPDQPAVRSSAPSPSAREQTTPAIVEAASELNYVLSYDEEAETEQSAFLPESAWYQDPVGAEGAPETASPDRDEKVRAAAAGWSTRCVRR